MKSNLEIVKDCDNFPYNDPNDSAAYDTQISQLWTFHLPNDPRPHGYIPSSIVQKIPWTPPFSLNPINRTISLLQPPGSNWRTRSNAEIETLLTLIRAQNIFPTLQKKRDESWPILGADFPIVIERSAASLFGIIGCGVHMTVYTHDAGTGEMKFWIPKRNRAKAAYAGMLDNAVAGGVAAGEKPFECLCREAEEEAGIGEVVMRGARAAGTVTWFNVSDERSGGQRGLMNPGVSYVYDLEISEDMKLVPVDGDVEGFWLMSVEEVREAMGNGKFKPLSACVMLDFFIRHGIITAEEEGDYLEIVSRLHRKLPFATSCRKS